MDKDTLRRRYQSLWIGEAVAITLFVFLLLRAALQDGIWQHWVARTYSLGVVILVLLQGIVWWRWKLQRLHTGRRHMPAHVLDSFRAWRRINWLLIGGFPLIVVLAAQWTDQPLASRDTWFGLLILGGAVLEQINYYYFQLMYDSAYDLAYLRAHRRLRRASIAQALDAQDQHTS